MIRQEANLYLLELILKQVEEYPDLRFNQILVNIGLTQEVKVEDEWDEVFEVPKVIYNVISYYEEPEVTLNRINGT